MIADKDADNLDDADTVSNLNDDDSMQQQFDFRFHDKPSITNLHLRHLNHQCPHLR
jgi:hypothetical protein